MAKNGPKFNKRTNGNKNQEAAAQTVPESAEEFLEEGATLEDSGDRWLSSDLAKALRFYQKAYHHYRSAMSMMDADPETTNMAGYNASRLLFHVYTEYECADGVDVHQLENVQEVLTLAHTSVVQPIELIRAAHYEAMQEIEDMSEEVPLDLLFNAAVVNIDAAEQASSASDVVEFGAFAGRLLRKVLRQQCIEADSFFTGTESPNIEDSDSPECPTSPADIMDTIVSIYNLTHVILDRLRGNSMWDAQVSNHLSPLNQEADNTAAEVFRRYSHVQGPGSLSEKVRDELEISKACSVASTRNSLQEYFFIWDSVSLPKTPERYMQAADSIDMYLQSSPIAQDPNYHPEQYWEGLCKMNLYLKAADELLQERLRAYGPSQQQGVGSLVAQICSVYIARADIDIQRSQLPYDLAIKNAAVLGKNAKAFLMNAMNFAKRTGGLRETASEKAKREKRRIEAVTRLCVLGGKTSSVDFDAIVGKGRWMADVDAYLDQWYMPINRVL